MRRAELLSLPWLLLVALYGAQLCSTLTLSTYFGAEDRARLKSLFTSKKALADLQSAHYAALGLSLLGEKIANPQDYCNVLKTVDQKNLEALFHATSGSKALGNCQLALIEGKSTLEGALKDDSTVPQLYHAVLSLKALGSAVDAAKVSQLLLAALKKDDSMINLGYAFHVASVLGGNVTPFTDRIEDAVVQADEVGGDLLQFEGGLSVTATILSGVYRLAEAANKAPAVSKEQVLKFANYLLSRKNVQTVKGAAILYDVLRLLSVSSKHHVPVAVTVSGSSALSARSPTVVVRLTDVLGAPLAPVSLLLNSAVRLSDGQTVLERKPFAPSKEDKTLYVYNFMSGKPRRGFYKLSLNAVPVQADARLLGNTNAEIQVKVLTEVEVVNLEVGTADRDQTAAPKMDVVAFKGKLAQTLEADHHQKLVMKFSLKDKSNADIMTAQQAFVHLQHQETKREIVFLAEPDSSLIYRFDLDLHLKAKEMGYLSGKYDLSLIIGDAVIANPLKWTLASLALSFPPNPSPPKDTVDIHAPRPEIKHLFREQEKRPPAFLSNAFCGLVLAPLLLLFVLWGRIGVNLSNFPFSLSTVLFHLGLAAIFGLFTCFWLRLTMFTTLKYLAALGAVTFISGHGMLTRLTQMKA
ncbi:dolichyl-diphosphooligosaccharide--protein glycosyltransferase subunit 2 [Ixodes scapularis]|uniref:dolichyl-diphosphooligosaccharide--protein glycosyltransferase subunit 2 n=1 Tax=Ixodes scapularis TaxID=6945 RepID=UPI001C386C70|nr:dolichyl-diphosphooligosaccharide--protein glycosyltransferase subunit 2 [Ixodes scapularis]